jgi:hypothetical protein
MYYVQMDFPKNRMASLKKEFLPYRQKYSNNFRDYASLDNLITLQVNHDLS